MTLQHVLKKMTLGDKVLVLCLALSTGVSFPLLSVSSSQGAWGIIEVNGERVRRVPLDNIRTYPVQGHQYKTRIAVRDGSIEITDHACPSPWLHSGRISRTGEFRVCVYNRVVIRVEGEDTRGLDVISK